MWRSVLPLDTLSGILSGMWLLPQTLRLIGVSHPVPHRFITGSSPVHYPVLAGRSPQHMPSNAADPFDNSMRLWDFETARDPYDAIAEPDLYGTSYLARFESEGADPAGGCTHSVGCL